MDYIVEKGKITVINPRDFDIRKTLECGQVFRYKKIDDGYEIIAKNQRARLKNVKNNGCRIADHGLDDEVPYEETTFEEVDQIFQKALRKENFRQNIICCS